MLPRHLPHVTAAQEADRSVVHVDVLGPLEIRTADTVQRPGAARQRRILTILAMSAAEGRTISSDELIDATYGADPPPRVRRSLSTELWRCRQLLGGDAIQGEADGYHLDTTQVEVDVLRFIRELEQGRALVECGEFADAAELLSLALDRWRGAPLPDWRDHPDGLASVARLEELRIGGSEDLCEALAGTGRHAEAAATLQTITRAHPAREHAWALLIECYLALGDRRRARTALDSARRTLAEHGVDLGVELRAVRDLLRVASGPAQPASRAAAVADAPSLAGRREPLTALVQVLGGALRERQTAAVVVTGEAGIGKSALLEHAVAELAGSAGGEQPTVGTVNCDRRLTLPLRRADGVVLPARDESRHARRRTGHAARGRLRPGHPPRGPRRPDREGRQGAGRPGAGGRGRPLGDPRADRPAHLASRPPGGGPARHRRLAPAPARRLSRPGPRPGRAPPARPARRTPHRARRGAHPRAAGLRRRSRAGA
ncbi:AfsR/SARP family transcriptional regulator [Nocardioides sp. TF02-7]|uniref:AfsR/SARP family transcriptional regulator n=1 Tax=Nocardioides sp. TF02-7 TaxID=2917724 RepID=UPI001F05779C|nr:AfsR/SARP family transcriptional regulator [Nocardioides sp. TF02-7]UMG94781.1 tetratricopeptide repeat protein [Nocardioides sp. TF02-7]